MKCFLKPGVSRYVKLFGTFPVIIPPLCCRLRYVTLRYVRLFRSENRSGGFITGDLVHGKRPITRNYCLHLRWYRLTNLNGFTSHGTLCSFLRLRRSQGHSTSGRIMSMKNSNNTIGNRTRDLPACSAVTQPTAPPRIP
jgi:hypothetical protein